MNAGSPNRVLRVAVWVAASILVLLGLLTALLLLVDVSTYRHQMEAAASAALGRKVTLAGDMRFAPSLLPRLVVEDVRVANPEWASQPYFARARRFEIVVALLPLLRDEVVVHELELDGADVFLEKGPDGSATWDFPGQEASLPSVESLRITDGKVVHLTAGGTSDAVVIQEAEGALVQDEPVRLELSGTYRDVSFDTRLEGGTPAQFLASVDAWPITAAASAADATLTLDGHLVRPLELGGLNVKLDLKGSRLDKLQPLVRTSLPALGPYELAGRLSAARDRLDIDDLAIQLAGSRVAGALYWSAAPGSAQLTGALTSETLHLQEIITALDALAPGTTSASTAETRKREAESLEGLDADLRLQVKELVYPPAPLRDISLHALTRPGEAAQAQSAGQLSLQGTAVWKGVPVEASLQGGTLTEMLAPDNPWPVRGTAKAGGASLDMDGTIAQPIYLQGLDLKIALRAEKLSDLDPLLAVELPALAPLQISGRLAASGTTYTLREIKARAGDSDLSGRLSVSTAGPRPAFSGELASRKLDLSRLLVTAKPPAGVPKPPPFPDSPLPALHLTGFDADVRLQVADFVNPALSAKDLSLRARVRDGSLSLDPWRARIPGGVANGSLGYGMSGAQPSVELQAQSEKLAIEQLFALLEQPPPITGEASRVTLRLHGGGRTWRELVKQADVTLTGGSTHIKFRNPERADPIRLDLNSTEIGAAKGEPLSANSQAGFGDIPLSVTAHGGTLADLLWGQAQWPIHIQAQGADASLQADGSIDTRGAPLQWVLAIRLDGKQLSALSELVGRKLPPAGPYSLSGTMRDHKAGFGLTDVKMHLGETKAEGSLTYDVAKPRPRFTAELTVDPLQLGDFYEPEPKGAPPEERDRVIPDFEIATGHLREVDGAFMVTIRHLLAGEEELATASLQANLRDGKLVASPITAQGESASYVGSLELQDSEGTAALDLWAKFEDEQFGRVLAGLGISEDLAADISIDAALSARGPDIRELLAQGQGHLTIVAGKGKVPGRLLRLWGGGLITALLPTNLLRKDEAELNCVVTRFKIQDGIASSDAILIDTTDITIGGHGAIDLRTEEIKFVFQPAPKRAALVSLGTPVTVTGTLAHPVIRAKGDATLLSLGKLAVGFLNPAYLVVLTTDTGTGVANPCVEAVARRDAGEAVSKPRGLLGRLGGLFKKPPKSFE